MTHLDETNTRRLIDKLLSSCNLDGLLAFSFHGQRAIKVGRVPYAIGAEDWSLLESDYLRKGYGYVDYRGQVGYGISVCSTAWIVKLFRSVPGVRLVLLSEAAWANHHDVAVVQKIGP